MFGSVSFTIVKILIITVKITRPKLFVHFNYILVDMCDFKICRVTVAIHKIGTRWLVSNSCKNCGEDAGYSLNDKEIKAYKRAIDLLK